METIQFQKGRKYYARSVCNFDCIWVFTVIDRTACTVTLKDEDGRIKKCRIDKTSAIHFVAESVKPLGNYSMAPILTANKTC